HCAAVRFSDDGRLLALVVRGPHSVSERDRHARVEIRDAATGELLRKWDVPGVVVGLSGGGGGGRLLLASRPTGSLVISDVWKGERVQTFPTDALALFHPDGKCVGVIAPLGERLDLYDLTTRKLLRSLPLPGPVTEALGYSP